ncbi:hypothetical protein ABK040_009177 [Willaertia magna]
MQDFPHEIIEIIFSFLFNTNDLYLNIYPIRYLNKNYFEFTQKERFWNILLIENQRLNNCNFHQWFFNILKIRNVTVYNNLKNNLENKLESLNDNYDSEMKIFQDYVNKWINMLSMEKDYNNCNPLILFLLKISLSQNVLEYLSPKNMISCFHYLFFKLLEPTLNLINNLQQENEEIKENNLFNLNILNFLQNLNKEDKENNIKILNNWYYPCHQSYWRIIDPYYSIFPRDLLLKIVDKLSNVKINNENVASFIVKELYKCGLFMHLTDFKEEINFIAENCNHLKPLFCKKFLLQHVACWKENEELLQFCLNPNNKIKQIDGILNSLQKEIKSFNEEKRLQDETEGIVSQFTMSNLTDNIGLTLLHYAVKQENLNFIKLLITKYNANPFARSKHLLISPIKLSTLLKKENVINLFKELIGEQFVEIHSREVDKLEKEEIKEFLEEDEKKEEELKKQDTEINELEININLETLNNTVEHKEVNNNNTLKEMNEEEHEEEYEEENEVTFKTIDLDETEQKDIQKIQIDKLILREDYRGYIRYYDQTSDDLFPLRENFTLERTLSCIDEESDEIDTIQPEDSEYCKYLSEDDDYEEIISLKTIVKNSKEGDNLDILQNSCNVYQNIENQVIHELNNENNLQQLLQPYENITKGPFNYYDLQNEWQDVKIGKRKLVNYNNEDNNNEDKKDLNNEPSEKKLKLNNSTKEDIILRKDLYLPKLPFRYFINEVAQDYRSDLAIAPMSYSILQQAVERLTGDALFPIANSISQFFNKELLEKEEMQIIKELFNYKQSIFYESFLMKENLIEFLLWKLNDIDLFSKIFDNIKKKERLIYNTYKINNCFFEFNNCSTELNCLLLEMTDESNNFNYFEKDLDDVNDLNSEDEEMEEHIYTGFNEEENEDGYSTDSNLSTVALYQSNNREGCNDIELIYLCDSEEKERKINEQLYHEKKIDNDYCNNGDDHDNNCENEDCIFYVENIPNSEDKLAYTNSRQIAMDWLGNDTDYNFLESEYLPSKY